MQTEQKKNMQMGECNQNLSELSKVEINMGITFFLFFSNPRAFKDAQPKKTMRCAYKCFPALITVNKD